MSGKRTSVEIVVASGKGGTGKTTVATNLASVLADGGWEVAYLDCDVEAPNGHIFLEPEIGSQMSVGLPVPVVDKEKCTLCGKCAEICQYGAILCLGEQVTVFPDLCHGCGGCTRVCPVEAIHEEPKELGVVEEGEAGAIHIVQGRLNIGQALSVPLIREVKKRARGRRVRIVDSPPGTSCPVIQSVSGADFVLMVAEPTPFGLNDLRIGVEMLRVLGLPLGVVINRAGMGNDDVRGYCDGEGIEVLLEIPDDRRVAEAYSRGELAWQAIAGYRARFETLFRKVEGRAAR